MKNLKQRWGFAPTSLVDHFIVFGITGSVSALCRTTTHWLGLTPENTNFGYTGRSASIDLPNLPSDFGVCGFLFGEFQFFGTLKKMLSVCGYPFKNCTKK